MPKPTKGPRLGGTPTHERIILGNLASQLFEYGRITTTETKARRMQPLAEKLITKAKRGDLHARRLVLSTITNKDIVHVLFSEIAPQMEGRDGGYTRITKVGNRKGDNAPMAVIELVTEKVEPKPARSKAKPAAAAQKAEPKASVKASAVEQPSTVAAIEEAPEPSASAETAPTPATASSAKAGDAVEGQPA